MLRKSLSISSSSPEETTALGSRIGTILTSGDVILLEGPIGAGKTHFARSLIQSTLSTYEDVPSPTFTLVQTYNTEIGEIWHADLYRLNSPNEVIELGLVDAFQDSICLIEWPDRLGELAPASALTMHFKSVTNENHRALKMSWSNTRWNQIEEIVPR